MAAVRVCSALLCLLLMAQFGETKPKAAEESFSKVLKEVKKIGRTLAKAYNQPDIFLTSKDLWGIAERVQGKVTSLHRDVFDLSAQVAALKKKYTPFITCIVPMELSYQGNCYWAAPKSIKKSYSKARADCWEADAELAHPEDLNDLNQFIEKKFPDENRYSASFFVGAANHHSNKIPDFRWFDGRMVRPEKRMWSEMMAFGDCIVLRKGGDISSMDCASERRYICQRPLQKE